MISIDFDDLIIDKNKPLQNQIYENLLSRIMNGRLVAGAKLPSSRNMSESLNVSRITVTQAIEKLKKEGLLTSRAGQGVFVSKKIPTKTEINKSCVKMKNNSNTIYSLPGLSIYGESINKVCLLKNGWPKSPPFSPGLPDLKEFPFKIWSKLLRQNLDRMPASEYCDASGYLPLKKCLSNYLSNFRGVTCTPGQVIITNGALEALNICIRVTLNQGDSVFMENPGYRRAKYAFDSINADLHLIQLVNGHLNVDYLLKRKKSAKLLYTTPTNQYPMGGVISTKERLKLLGWAEQSNTWILEDDYDSGFLFENKPISALQGFKKNSPIVYTGSFSKTLMPRLRVGYLVVPEQVAPAFINAKSQLSGPNNLLGQAVISDFIDEGHFARHIRRMRRNYQEKWAHFCSLLRENLEPNVKLISNGVSMHVILDIPEYDDVTLSEKLIYKGFGSTPLSAFYHGKEKKTGLVLGFANTSSQQREALVEYLKTLL
ncbi:MocR-like pyridoxine biosynthesis transcription factor PdxR [Microbulbifer epialgicus]|uniref:PLP-dependent aminotransferase family protein n=1 Tax=Microbulbifer epialgicus TaxID=393907 RepID=A0ABV4P5W2_9GAMM